MKEAAARAAFGMFCLHACLSAQTTPSAIAPATPAPAVRPIGWTRLIPNIVEDQKAIWLFPAKLGHRKYLFPTLAVVGVTAGLIAVDPFISRYFATTNSFQDLNKALPGRGATYGLWLTPVALYATGFFRKDAYMRDTALFAAEAVAGSEILTTVMKDLDRRTRPAAVGLTNSFADGWFESKGKWYQGNGSFPSGHTIAAFAIATIVARRYSHHHWLPFAAYGIATLVAFSRVTLLSHFSSDVLMGAALGYSISRFVVLRQ